MSQDCVLCNCPRNVLTTSANPSADWKLKAQVLVRRNLPVLRDDLEMKGIGLIDLQNWQMFIYTPTSLPPFGHLVDDAPRGLSRVEQYSNGPVTET